jgi:hypothetical protein
MRQILQNFLLFFLLFAAISCSQDKNSKVETDFPVKPLIIPGDDGDQHGDGDFTLSIISISQNDTGKIYKAVSSYKNEELGLLIFVPNSRNGNKGFGNGIILKSIGKQSDRLLALFAALYKQKLPANSKFVNSVSVEYVDLSAFAKSLGGSVPNNESNIMEYKLFFKNKDDEAELYLNIKTKEQLVEIDEKDEEYRPTIIKILEAH